MPRSLSNTGESKRRLRWPTGTPQIIALLLVLALIAEKMPYASRSGIAAMTQLGKEAEEAARIAGAGWFARIRRIVIPIQAAPLATGVQIGRAHV